MYGVAVENALEKRPRRFAAHGPRASKFPGEGSPGRPTEGAARDESPKSAFSAEMPPISGHETTLLIVFPLAPGFSDAFRNGHDPAKNRPAG
jgi:hypothetical protein